MNQEQIKYTLLKMYNDNKYYMQLPKNSEVTQVQFNNWIDFLKYLFGELTYIKDLSQKQFYKLINDKIKQIDYTVEDIYIRMNQEEIKSTQEYKTIQDNIKYYYGIQNKIQDKISEILHYKKPYVNRLKNRDKILMQLQKSREKYHCLMIEQENKLNKLLKEIENKC